MPAHSPAPAPLPAPTGQIFAYATSSDTSSDISISIFRVLDDGALDPAGTVPSDSGATSVSLHPSGRFAYAVDEVGGRISAYTIEVESGMLDFIHAVDLSSFSGRLHIHPSGRFIYAVGGGDVPGVLIYDIADGGMLVNGRRFDVGIGVLELALHPSGSLLYIAGMDSMLYAYSIDAAGGLVLQNSVASAEDCSAMVVSPTGATLHLSAGFTIFTHTIGPMGQLGAASSVEGDEAFELAVAASGKYLYVKTTAGARNPVVVYEIAQAGGLIERGSVNGSYYEGELTFHPTGSFLYTADGAAHTVSRYSVHEETGALAEVPPPVAAGLGTFGICVARIAAA